jgi:predicted  nucleic acid-binding Zn-ribbon protein
MTEQQLLNLKKQVDEAKSSVSELEGHKKALMKQLKDEWNLTTVEAAQKKLDSMAKQIDTLTIQIEEGLKEME